MYRPDTPEDYLIYNLTLFMQNNDFTHAEAAAYIGVTLNTFNNWLNKRSKPTTSAKELLEKAFKMPYGQICSRVLTIKLEQSHRYCLEDIYPYNVLIAALQPYSGMYVRSDNALSDFEQRPDINFNIDYRTISPAEIETIIVTALTERQQLVIRYRYIDGLTLDATGSHLGVQRERIRQIEAKSLRTIHRRIYDILSMRETKVREFENLKKDYIELKTLTANTDVAKNIGIAHILEKNIDALDLCTRARCCLQRYGLTTVKKIVEYKEPFSSIRNLGTSSIRNIVDTIDSLNLPYTFDIKACHFIPSTSEW